MVRVIPGVEVKVVKEIVPQQLFPAGVVGMIGTANDGPVGIPTAVTSYQRAHGNIWTGGAWLYITQRRKKCISQRRISSSSNKSRRFC